jgi:NADH-quinone oxidoreductase subunit L
MDQGTLFKIILLSPLAGFVINGVFGKKLQGLSGWIGSAAVLLSFISAIFLFRDVAATDKPILSQLFSWLNVGTFQVNLSFQADRLSAIMLLVVTGVGFLIHLYSIAYMHDDSGLYKFFAYLNLFIFSMLLLVLGSNFVVMFFGWEGVGLCSYLLIGFWFNNEAYGKAARKAFVMNRIGDLGLLVGLFLIYFQFGTFEYSQVFEKVETGAYRPEILTAICIALFIGATGKSAQIPLFTWLPDAMAGPTPVSALIHAATMVTAGIYMVVRCNVMFNYSPLSRDIILYTGLLTSIIAALIGLKQNDIKKVLAYSTVSQLGLMFVALGCGAYTAALFHVVTHAFFKALLFLGSGSVIHAMHGAQDIRVMGGLKRKLPVTYWTFLIGTLAISGFPLLSGFFSKDEILLALYDHNAWLYPLALGSAFITAFYMFRLLLVTFHGSFRGTVNQYEHLHESPMLMSIPLIILAVCSIFGGLLNLPHYAGNSAQSLHHWLEPILADQPEHAAHSFASEMMFAGFAVAGMAIAFLLTRKKYVTDARVPEADAEMIGPGKLLGAKFMVDEAYDKAIVEPLEHLSDGLHDWSDRKLIDGAVQQTGNITGMLGNLARFIQSGNIEWYLLLMVLSMAAILGINLFI